MTDRITQAKARTKALAEADRKTREEALKRKQAKLRAETKRDSKIPARMVRP